MDAGDAAGGGGAGGGAGGPHSREGSRGRSEGSGVIPGLGAKDNLSRPSGGLGPSSNTSHPSAFFHEGKARQSIHNRKSRHALGIKDAELNNYDAMAAAIAKRAMIDHHQQEIELEEARDE